MESLFQTDNQERINQVPISNDHNITAYYNRDKRLCLRQINNPIIIPNYSLKHLRNIIPEDGSINIPPDKIDCLVNGSINNTEIIDDITTFIFLSSNGLVSGSDKESSQPSEGIIVLSEWLARNEPTASPLFIDPNIIPNENLKDIILEHISYSKNIVFGLSVIPVNLKNDINMIKMLKEIAPDSKIVVGGIGSETLDTLPLTNGERGIKNALPVDYILKGSGLKKLQDISRNNSRSSIETSYSGNEIEEQTMDIMKSRIIAKNKFTPFDHGDIIHKRPYNIFNASQETVASVLIDNRCSQNCFFCSSTKQGFFTDIDSAADYIQEKTKNAEIISFYDNDLSNDTDNTIGLCHEMVRRDITQPKHGKMSIRKYSPDLIDALANANFKRIAMGVESFDQTVRARLGKGNFTNENISKTIEHMLSSGIQPEINLIICSPSETEQSIKLTTEKALEYADRGCLVFTTIGLYAVPNSPAVAELLKKDTPSDNEKIQFETVEINDAVGVLLPKYWNCSDYMNCLRDELKVKKCEAVDYYQTIFEQKMPVHIECYITVALLGLLFEIVGFETEEKFNSKVMEYIRSNIQKPYINI